MRTKGKVHPLASSSSSSQSQSQSQSQSLISNNKDSSFPVLKLLPTAIITLISVLCFEEREVLAYMISRSLNSSNPSFLHPQRNNNNIKKNNGNSKKQSFTALFDCDCFHCYTSFWFRWDSSPNRKLIHHAIEAFEEHLNNKEQDKTIGKIKRKEKMGRRNNYSISGGGVGVLEFPVVEKEGFVAAVPDVKLEAEKYGSGEAEEVMVAAARPVVVLNSHRGFARKVLPDIMGIVNSRLWSLWSPNM